MQGLCPNSTSLVNAHTKETLTAEAVQIFCMRINSLHIESNSTCPVPLQGMQEGPQEGLYVTFDSHDAIHSPVNEHEDSNKK
jgi:hypothetical protein